MLWELEWDDARVSCAVYRQRGGMELRVETGAGVIACEPFEMEPKHLARARTLRESLKRRGWRERSAQAQR